MLKTLLKTVACATAIASMGFGAASSAEAQVRGDKAIYFTFSEPVALPQVTLPAGRYLFRLADSLVNRTIVQIYSADGAKLHAMLMTIPAQRNDRPDDPEVRFLETEANRPPAIATYWYPGEQRGWEFVYPRTEAVALARSSQQAVLTTAEDTSSAEEMRSAQLARVTPAGEQIGVDADVPVASTQAPAARQRVVGGEVAADVPESTLAQNTTPAASTAPRTRLPATATNNGTVLLIGLVALSFGLGVGLWRRLA